MAGMSTPAALSADPLPLLRLALAPGPREPRRRLLESLPRQLPGPDTRLPVVPTPVLDRCLAWLAQPGHHFLAWNDPRYPPLLRQCTDAPLGLFVAGDPDHLWQPMLALVGSRGASAGGRDNARAFAAAFCRAGVGVASGLAAGIDGAAHQAALDAGGLTVAVLGTGPDRPYPRHHGALMERVAAHGAVVSEHPPGTPPRAIHFPARNRIIAGLSLGTVVVEAALRSGALITARVAAEYGREVFALPGSIHHPQARGCHRLIRDGAQLVEGPAEVLAGIAPLAGRLARDLDPGPATTGAAPEPGNAASAPSSDHDILWHAIGHDPTPMDVLAERTGLTPATLSSMLLAMELDGRIAVEHGRYARRSTGGGAVA